MARALAVRESVLLLPGEKAPAPIATTTEIIAILGVKWPGIGRSPPIQSGDPGIEQMAPDFRTVLARLVLVLSSGALMVAPRQCGCPPLRSGVRYSLVGSDKYIQQFASSLSGVGGNDRSCLSTDVFRFGRAAFFRTGLITARRGAQTRSRMAAGHRGAARSVLCAGHVQQPGGASPLCNLMEVKHE